MDLRILLLATILFISASNGHQETKKSAPSVLKNMGAIRKIAAIAKKKMMKTRVLKDEETCGTCMEMVEDLKTLIASDYGINNINSLIWAFCEISYMATPETDADLDQCKQALYITPDDAQYLSDQIDPEYLCSMTHFCYGTLLASEKLKMKKIAGLDDDEMCGTCIEMFEDMTTLISSDEGKENIISVGDTFCEVAYFVGLYREPDYEQCKQWVARLNGDLVSHYIFPENLCSMFLMWNGDGCVEKF